MLRLVFERGDVTLSEWVPTRVRVHALTDERQARELARIFPGAHLETTATIEEAERISRSRGKQTEVHQVLELTQGENVRKGDRYSEALRAMFTDQVAWIRDRDHQRRITEENARASLATACSADRLAHAAVHQAEGQ
jgi:hypothetical protein